MVALLEKNRTLSRETQAGCFFHVARRSWPGTCNPGSDPRVYVRAAWDRDTASRAAARERPAHAHHGRASSTRTKEMEASIRGRAGTMAHVSTFRVG